MDATHVDERPHHERGDGRMPNLVEAGSAHHLVGENDRETLARADGHGGHRAHVDHTGHKATFHWRLRVSRLLSIPVLLSSDIVRDVFGFAAMTFFPESALVTPVRSMLTVVHGEMPSPSKSLPEFDNRQLVMVLTVSLVIIVAVDARRFGNVDLSVTG